MSIELVAREAGVSIATVSRVFNAPHLVREKTREKIQSIAVRLRYQPNESARALRTQRSKTFGVLLPTLRNPVFAECLEGIAERAGVAGYSIIPSYTKYQRELEDTAVGALIARGIDGIVLVVSDAGTSQALKRIKAAGLAYVLVYNRHSRHPCISVDSESAVARAVEFLAQKQHRDIAMVTGELTASDRAKQRHAGFVRGLRACGLPPGKVLEIPFMEDAVDRLSRFLQAPHRPTAVICSNDLLAIRTLRAAAQASLRVPDDLSVLGFDGIAIGADLSPSLSTIAQPNGEIGAQAVELLLQAIESGVMPTAKDSQTLDCTLQERESISERRFG